MEERFGQPGMECNVGVDLTPMRPGGANGGVKPAILTFLQVLEGEHAETFRFTFLTNSSTHNDLLSLVWPRDVMLCVFKTAPVKWGRL